MVYLIIGIGRSGLEDGGILGRYEESAFCCRRSDSVQSSEEMRTARELAAPVDVPLPRALGEWRVVS